jgi:phosphoribosylanthranilate isomerase
MVVKVKICGMCHGENIRDVAALHPDYIGFIFYPKSKRYVNPAATPESLAIGKSIKKVGVFVNEEIGKMVDTVNQCALDMIQLHGDETPDQCESIRHALPSETCIIKAVSVKSEDDVLRCRQYDDVCDYILTDTYTPAYGGSGMSFDHAWLKHYDSKLPLFVSGGIGLDEIDMLLQLARSIPIHAIDMNSRLEISPGLKDTALVKSVFHKIRNAHGIFCK